MYMVQLCIINLSLFRWMKQLGSEPLSPEQKTDVLEERATAREEYLLTQAEFSKENEFRQTQTQTSAVRYSTVCCNTIVLFVTIL